MKNFILYTDREGGEWIPFNTPVSQEGIRAILRPADQIPICLVGNHAGRIRVPYDHICHQDGNTFFVPQSDVLPAFHSILLPTAARWDARKREWTFYVCSEGFSNYWQAYIENYRPSEQPQERKFWWLDQGPYTTWKEISEYAQRIHQVRDGE